MKLRRLGVFGAGLLSLVSVSSYARADTPPMTRQEIIELGESVVGYSYWWGGATWDPSVLTYPGRCAGAGCPNCTHSATSGGPEYGSDCSGLVGHAWKLVSDTPLEGGHSPYATADFLAGTEHWSRIDRADLLPGDALVRSGHIVLFESWAADGNPNLFECAGCQTGCVHSTRPLGPEYVAIRRTNVDASAPPAGDAAGELTQASCDGFAGTTVAGNGLAEIVFSFDAPNGSYFAKRKTAALDENGAFELPFPETLRDGKRHAVYAYLVDGTDEKLLIGAPVVLRCGNSGQSSSAGCNHDPCTPGAALVSSCNACTASICDTRPSCCSASWDQSCVDLVGETLGSCAGLCAGGPSSCQHDECSVGSVLSAACSACAKNVCERDAFCCDDEVGEWDFICAKEAADDAYCACES